jgi:tRNA threonylcarbamoyladenosine modification (KEOPS) complex Cgi121 subunit
MEKPQRFITLLLFEVALGREQERRYHVGVSGFGDCHLTDGLDKVLARVRALRSDQPLLKVQLFDAERIATYLHLLASAVHALQAFRTSRNVSKSIEIENLLYASAGRQIDDAIDKVGLKWTSQNVAANIIGSESDIVMKSMEKVRQELGGQANDSVLNIRDHAKTEVIMRTFEISDTELEAAKTEVDTEQVEAAVVKRILSKMSIMSISS